MGNLTNRHGIMEAPRSRGLGSLRDHFDTKIKVVEGTYRVGERLGERQKQRWDEEREMQRQIKESERQYRQWRRTCRSGCQIPPHIKHLSNS